MHLLPKVILLIVRTLSQRNLSAGLLSSPSGKLIVRLDGMDKKCRLGTDSTFGAWLRAHSAWDGAEGGGEHQQGSRGGGARSSEPIVAVDLLNFNMMWPWPLPDRCHGSNAERELANLHALHLYGKVAKEPTYWAHMHRTATLVHERDAATSNLSSPPRKAPRLHCKHAPDSADASLLLRRWQSEGVAAKPAGPPGWLERHVKGVGIAKGTRLDPAEWLFCGVYCQGDTVDERGRPRCQRAWPEMRL